MHRYGLLCVFLLTACSSPYVAPTPPDTRAEAPVEDVDAAWVQLETRAAELGTVTERKKEKGRLVFELGHEAQDYVTCGRIDGAGLSSWEGPWIASHRRAGSKVDVTATGTVHLTETAASVDARYAVNIQRGETTATWAWSTGGRDTKPDPMRQGPVLGDVSVTCTGTGELEAAVLAPLSGQGAVR